MRYDICKLIGQEFETNEIGDTVAVEHERIVYCAVSSIGLKRQLEAMTAGLKLSYKITLADEAEYHNEEIVEYNGVRYNVVNVYVTDNFAVELTVSRY